MKFLSLLFFLSSFIFSSAQPTVLQWQILHPIKKCWIDAGASGSVQQALIAAQELPDPYYGLNESKFDWIEDHIWEFVSTFNLEDFSEVSSRLELEFPGIDTYAQVYLNDSLLFSAENCFRPYRSQIRNSARKGSNILKVIFTPPILFHKERYDTEKFHYPAANDVGKIAVAPYTRKPQYQFGWDWALRMNTIGFMKPVLLHHYDQSRIIGKNCTTIHLSDTLADLDLALSLALPLSGEVLWKSKLFGDQVLVCAAESLLSRSVSIANPKLWWPRGQGNQELYEDNWFLYDQEGKLVDSISVKFGIRKSELIVKPDHWGTSFFVKFNNRPLFCKGGDYIPQDMFPTKVEDQAIIDLIDQMVVSNFNMVRVWGGGYYPDDLFYDVCDTKGLMVWQDLMFACAMYPGDSLFLNNVKGELEYQIPRISGHPCLTLFNGNNEVDVAWKNWGFQKKYGIYDENAKEIENSYDRLFKELAPGIISSFTNSPYVHTSPLSNWGKEEYYNHGTMHYWGVWHGKDPLVDFGKKSGRFNAEYGFQSFPEFSTLSTFSTESEWDLDSDVMKHHQKSYVGNGMILKHATQLFGKPSSFEEFIYFSQLTQSKAVSIAIAGHRTGVPKCMGTLYWQVNDCWQAPTWSGIDYFGNWKALQYTVRQDYEDVGIVAKIQELGKEEYFLVSDAPTIFNCKIKCSVFNEKGEMIVDQLEERKVVAGTVEKVAIGCKLESLQKQNYLLQFEWNDGEGKLHKRSFAHMGDTHEKADSSTVTFALSKPNKKEKTIVLTVKNEELLLDFWVSSSAIGVKFSENFENYLPGTHKIILTYKGNDLDLKTLKFFWR
jgi:beta-mannosidase